MSLFIKTFNEFKKKFLYFLLIDTIFFGLLFYFLVFVKNRLKNYLFVLQDYGSELSKIENLTQKDLVTSMKLDIVLRMMDSITSNALLFIYVLIPIILFLLFWIMHWLIFSIIYKNKIRELVNLKHFLKFGVISIPFFAIFIFIFLKLFDVIDLFFKGALLNSLLIRSLFYLVSFLLLGNYNFIIYSLFNKYNIKDLFRKSFKIYLKKFYILMPLFLLLIIILFIIMIPFSYLFLKQSVLGLESKDLSYLFLFIPLFLILGFYRMFLYYMIEKNE